MSHELLSEFARLTSNFYSVVPIIKVDRRHIDTSRWGAPNNV
jgi:hypothetical protein